MCLQCAMWLCTPESTETQTQKNTQTDIWYMHVETQKNTHVLTKQARSPCSELLSRWPWSRMMPLQSTKTQNQELTSDFYVTTSKQFPLVLTLQHQNNDTKTYHCIYHPATWNLDWSSLWDQAHTSYLSRTPRIYSCKFFLARVNFFRFNAKIWQFTVYFAVITQKIGNLLCILS